MPSAYTHTHTHSQRNFPFLPFRNFGNTKGRAPPFSVQRRHRGRKETVFDAFEEMESRGITKCGLGRARRTEVQRNVYRRVPGMIRRLKDIASQCEPLEKYHRRKSGNSRGTRCPARNFVFASASTRSPVSPV